jgi:hypothetical protein
MFPGKDVCRLGAVFSEFRQPALAGKQCIAISWQGVPKCLIPAVGSDTVIWKVAILRKAAKNEEDSP